MPSQADADVNPDVEAILECLEDPAILLGRDYRILRANSAYQALYGDARALASRHCYEVSHRYAVPCDQAGESCPLKRSLETGDNSRVLHIHHTPRGEEYVNVEMWPVKDPATGVVSCFIEIMRPSRVASVQARPEGLVGRSAAFQKALALAERVAGSEATVMLLGESGTGKELLAEAIHRMSDRAGGPFVPVECAGLPDTLFESELFGYVKGAFTGATADKPGLVEAAAGGTLFLDEIGEVPLSEQVKLLRLLETRRFRRVGSTEWRDTDFRLVCATNQDLAALVREGAFRQDLYYRLNVFEIVLPPLRARTADLEPLTRSILDRLERTDVSVSPDAMQMLRGYPFPGNVRELRNLLERAVLLADGQQILPEHLPEAVRSLASDTAPGAQPSGPGDALIPLAAVEENYLRRAVATFPGDRRALARALGISERALYRKLARLAEVSR
ncbi:MAG: sigma-54 interaction domain-containing protein [Pseudomonadales bacterium]